MASTSVRKNGDRTRSYLTQVRVKGFRPTSKTFHEQDYHSPREAAKAAAAWGEAQEQELRELRKRGGMRADVASITFGQLVDEYLKDEESTALATFKTRALQLAWWSNKYRTVKAIEFPNPVRLRDARKELREYGAGDGKLGPATCNRYMAAARHCWNFGRNAGLVPKDNVWPPGLMLTEPKARERYLTGAEVGRALAAARKEANLGGPLMHAAVMFAIGVGCRQSEQLRVRWCDVDEKSHTVAITVTKTDTSRRVYLAAAVAEVLKKLRTAGNVRRLPGAYVFASADGAPIKQHALVDAWERVRVSAGLPDVRWHDLRHAAASFLVQGGSTLAEVAHQLGHQSVATSKRYAHLVPGAKPTGADKLNEHLLRGPK